MDALGNVATRTGAALFSGENADLRASFGHQMHDLLKSGVAEFADDDEDYVFEAEDVPEIPESEPAEAGKPAEAGEAAQEPAEAPEEPVTEESGDQ